jgi:hypothetical protein
MLQGGVHGVCSVAAKEGEAPRAQGHP